ncbi:MAG: NAD(P)-dependent oxidoreductase [Candidatus Sericytochromatia bacterium]
MKVMKVSVLGTGLMGGPMALRLKDCGHQVTVWNRSRDKLGPLADAGLSLAEDPAAAVTAAETVILMLADFAAIESVLAQVPAADWAGRNVVQSGTIAPVQSRQLAGRLRSAGAGMLECPVLGSLPQARDGSLILIAAGPDAVLQACRPLLDSLGTRLHVLGHDPGQATAAKLALNQLIPSLIAMFGLSLHYIQRQDIHPEDWMQILRESALFAPSFDKKLDRLLSADFSNPNFPIRHMLKDVGLFLETAAPLGLDTRMLTALQELLQKCADAGQADADYSAVGQAVAS